MKTSGKNKILFLKEDYADGQETFTYPDGSKYVGEFKDGEPHGQEHSLGLMGKSVKGNSRMGK